MYTNIRTGPALNRIGRFTLNNENHLDVPPAVLIDGLHLLVKNNVFQFGDTNWLQKVVTVTGSPPNPPWSTIFFDIPEEAVLDQFGDSLQLYHQFIDDVLGIWLVDPNPVLEH